MKHLILLIIRLILIGVPIFSFSQTTIHINPINIKKGNIVLNDIATHIEYIPLETKPNCLIGEIGFFDISSNYIVVFCNKSNAIYLFKHDGTFVTKIGNEGNGPGEYLGLAVTGIFLDENNQWIIIQTRYPQNLLYYDLQGNYIKTKKTDENMNTIQFLHNDHFLVTYVNSNGRVPYIYEMRTLNLSVVSRFGTALPYKLVGAPDEGANTLIFPTVCYYLYEDKLHVKQTNLNDTLFAVTKDSYYPKYLINAGKYEITPELRGDFKNFIYRIDNYVKLNNIFETKEYLLFSFLYERKIHYCYYDKKMNTIFQFASDGGIPNNLDGGLPFWAREQRNEYLYGFYSAESFEEMRHKKRQPNRSKELDKLVYQLDFDDNPVIVAVRLKE